MNVPCNWPMPGITSHQQPHQARHPTPTLQHCPTLPATPTPTGPTLPTPSSIGRSVAVTIKKQRDWLPVLIFCFS